MIKYREVMSNGKFSILDDPYDKKQDPNQQKGLDIYVGVLDHSTGEINHVKLYENTKGRFFKKRGNHYLSDFTEVYIYSPLQIFKK